MHRVSVYSVVMDNQGEDDALPNAAAAFIGAAVTLILVVVFLILIIILVKQCIALKAKRRAVRERQIQEVTRVANARRRRGSVTEAVPATFDWHHSIRIEGTPPPSYGEAEKLPPIKDGDKKPNPNAKEDKIMLEVVKLSESTSPLVPGVTERHEFSPDNNQGFSSQYSEFVTVSN